MTDAFMLGLVQNVSLLLAMALLFDSAGARWRPKSMSMWQVPFGLLIGGIGVAIMLSPWVLMPGVVFDTRSVLLGISGLFFGVVPTTIAMLMTMAFRIYQGGAGVLMGCLVIVSTGTLGVAWRQIRRTPIAEITPGELYGFGLLSHLVMLLCTLALPSDMVRPVLSSIALPVLLIYPLGTVLLGQLMANRLRQETATEELRRRESRLRSLVEILQRPAANTGEYLQNALEEALALSGSSLGYVYAPGDNAGEFVLQVVARSAGTLPKGGSPASRIIVDESPLWNEAVRKRAPVIGTSPSHASLASGHFMALPIYSSERLVALVGVANKTEQYTESDALQLTLLLDSVWKLVERKHIEESLREAEARAEAIIQNLPNGLIHVLDRDLRYLYNAGVGMQRLGLTNETMVGKSIFDVLEPGTATHLAAACQRVLSGESVQLEGEFGGESFLVHAAPLRDAAGQVNRILALSINITDRKRAEMQLLEAQAELREMLTASDRSRRALLSLVEDQRQSEERIRELNSDLEQRVHDRTAQLEAANQELEAFAYSVSHDLRAPLRALNGFSSALLDDYHDSLDEQGQHFLMRIQEASRRMGQLIDDLLRLSRVTRRELKREDLNLSQLAEEIAEELKAQDPDRSVDFLITPDLTVQADPHLMRIALENLLNNAYKFSAKTQHACIQVGAVEQNGQPTYFVRDNGVGFDMTYVNKLFAPFQRLHSPEQFAGTGIGLVTVQRIITRHGGRVWPHAGVNEGATFFFTLGTG
jgi:PAS domain S-box-containing protein